MLLKEKENRFINTEKIEIAIKMIIEAIGEDVNREGLIETPKRVAKMYKEIFSGINQDPKNNLLKTFEEEYKGLVLVKNIHFHSMCEHHLLPFWGEAHIGYIPTENKIVGLSKLARTLETIARRPQTQERITYILLNTIIEVLNPTGAFVILEAEHMCMAMRGINKHGSKTTTSLFYGIFEDDELLKKDVLSSIYG